MKHQQTATRFLSLLVLGILFFVVCACTPESSDANDDPPNQETPAKLMVTKNTAVGSILHFYHIGGTHALSLRVAEVHGDWIRGSVLDVEDTQGLGVPTVVGDRAGAKSQDIWIRPSSWTSGYIKIAEAPSSVPAR